MNDTMVPELELDPRLRDLIKACERGCVAECCGLSAFEFTPLYVASHLSNCSCLILTSDVDIYHGLLDDCVKQVANLKPNGGGYVCQSRVLCEHFTQQTFDQFVHRLKTAVSLSPKMALYSDQLMKEAINPVN